MCIHCATHLRSKGVYCVDCWAQVQTRARVASRTGKGFTHCVNRGNPTRAVKVQRVIDWYGDDLTALDPPRGNDSRGMAAR